MSDEADTNMGGVSPERQHAELANDASNIAVTTETEERAAKRLKMDDEKPVQTVSIIVDGGVPGEGLHDAPARDENVNPTGEENKNQEGDKVQQKPEHIDGRLRGTAPVKKE